MSILTEQTHELLIMLNEESGEVVQAISKLARHGPHSVHPDYPVGPDNLQRLHNEIGDFMAIVGALINCELLDEQTLLEAEDRKRERMTAYMHGKLRW